ncbi:MAG TPA: dihydropteroate synthase-like protein [Candidatus Methanoperedenaceae archaeon]|nr:dihydropteroate synthase-like protein [Candidatus Methanoperedenaceae archaeon]
MNILVVTGRRAFETAKTSVGAAATVRRLETDIAAFITPKMLESIPDSRNYDLILIPGLISADFSSLEKKLGIPIRRGPKHACDLGFVLQYAGSVEFSTRIPACELLRDLRRTEAVREVESLEDGAQASFHVKGLKIGGSSRMKVMAEIVDATRLDEDELREKVNYFVSSGADIIDLGAGLDASPADVTSAVATARALTSLPVSIDTLNPDHILAGIKAGADIVLSLNRENIGKVGKEVAKSGAAAVVIPDDGNDDIFSNIRRARACGIINIIADPVIEPVGHGFVDSLAGYSMFRKANPATPLFFGAGNITELFDADSIGINALLAGAAMELRAAILFTPEFSSKAHGSIGEMKAASMMMALAQKRGTAPKDLGIDLLVIKEKRKREYEKPAVNAVSAEPPVSWQPDPKGSFRIGITGTEIVARHRDGAITGAHAADVFNTIMKMGLVSRPDHAAYLGRELMKAELAIKFRRSYAQDDDF